jgi:hypothetical protein
MKTEITLAPSSFRLPDQTVKDLLAEIEVRPDGARKRRVFDLGAELRDLRVEDVYTLRGECWRFAVRLGGGHCLSKSGEREWEDAMRLDDRLEEVRFATFEEAQAALKLYLDAL